MPAPSIVVTLVDTDGDEYPVRVWAMRDQFTETELAAAAIYECDRLREDSRWNPTYPVTIGAVEYWNQL